MTTENEAFEKIITLCKANNIVVSCSWYKDMQYRVLTCTDDNLVKLFNAIMEASKAESDKKVAELQANQKEFLSWCGSLEESKLEGKFNFRPEDSYFMGAIKTVCQLATTDFQVDKVAELQADNNRLRNALEEIIESGLLQGSYKLHEKINHIAHKAIHETTAQSLQAHDDEVIERCANVCDAYGLYNDINDVDCAEAVRKLKGK